MVIGQWSIGHWSLIIGQWPRRARDLHCFVAKYRQGNNQRRGDDNPKLRSIDAAATEVNFEIQNLPKYCFWSGFVFDKSTSLGYTDFLLL